jgi:hypothetical protein
MPTTFALTRSSPGAAPAAVHHAEVVRHKVRKPFGSLVLTVVAGAAQWIFHFSQRVHSFLAASPAGPAIDHVLAFVVASAYRAERMGEHDAAL